MTSDTGDKNEKSAGAHKPWAARRPAPTIELKATELTNEPAADKRSADADTPATPDVGAKGSKASQKTETGAGSVPPQDPERPKRPILGRLPGGLPLSLIGAAVAAAIVFFLIGLAIANLFVGREVAADAQLEQTQVINDLSDRLTKLEAAVTVPHAPDAALMTRIAGAEAAAKLAAENVAAQQRRADELMGLVRETRSRADAAIAAAENAQAGSGAATPEGMRIDAEALNQRIASLEQALKAADAERAAIAADDRKSRVAVVSAILLSAVERGVPFAAELAAAKALAPDSNGLAPLESFAAGGVPSPAALSHELRALIPAMLKLTERETPQDGGFLDKLQANAERLVRIRPVGEVAGDRPVDVLTRIEAKAGSSDITGALQELAKLPPQIRTPAEGWIRKADARNVALAAARQFSIGALAALGKPNM